MASNTRRLFHFAYPIAVLALASLAPSPALADFFDGARRTFQTDIPNFFTKDVPHFFQDDIPCAFGGQPTSHTRTSCKSSAPSDEHATDKNCDPASAPSDKPNDVGNAPVNSNKY